MKAKGGATEAPPRRQPGSVWGGALRDRGGAGRGGYEFGDRCCGLAARGGASSGTVPNGGHVQKMSLKSRQESELRPLEPTLLPEDHAILIVTFRGPFPQGPGRGGVQLAARPTPY